MQRPPFTFTDLKRHMEAAEADFIAFAAAGNVELAALRFRDGLWLLGQIEALRAWDRAQPLFVEAR